MENEVLKALREEISISVPLAGKAFGLGRNGSYEAVKRGEIPSVKIGRKRIVPTAPLRRMLGLESGGG